MSRPTSILFIGNSFTNRNDVPGLVRLLAASGEPPLRVETEKVIANGMALKTHWARGTARETIAARKWDYVVLQEQSTLPLKNPQRMHESVTTFDQEIRRHGARTVLYMTWARRNAPQSQDALSEAYSSIGRSLGAIVVPVGLAWQRVLKEHPEIALHDRDQSHPSPAGSYLAACVFCAVLFGQDPLSLSREVPWLPTFSAVTAQSLQQAAREAGRAT